MGQTIETKPNPRRNADFTFVGKELMKWHHYLIFDLAEVAFICTSVCLSKFQAA
jgi:hypothetical protein